MDFSRFDALEGYEASALEGRTAAVVGLGATGSVIAEHLARHGVNLILIDRDYLEPSDLYSSNIFTQEQVGKSLPKTEAAAEKLEVFTDVRTETESLDLECVYILDGADIVLDGTDNLPARRTINYWSKSREVPWVYTASLGARGFSMIVKDSCFESLIQNRGSPMPNTCESEGVMREIASKVASISSKKAIDFLSDRDVEERLETADGRSYSIEFEGCQVCEEKEKPSIASKNAESVCGEGKFEIDLSQTVELDLSDLNVGLIAENSYLKAFDYEGRRVTVFSSGRAIVEARDSDHARQTLAELGI